MTGPCCCPKNSATSSLEDTGRQAVAEQARFPEEIQQESFRWVPVVPLGRYFNRAAYSARLTGFLKSASSYPSNVRWA